MEILGTERFNESIAIKPVTRRRLLSNVPNLMYSSAEEMRQNFKIGDVAMLDRVLASNGFSGLCVFLPRKTKTNYKYFIENGILPKEYPMNVSGWGGFVLYDRNVFRYFDLKDFDSALNYSDGTLRITKVWRKGDTAKPFNKNYFTNPPTVKLIWKTIL